MLTKLLIANRGEIAVRVIRTARDLGYRTVAVYSEADANALHVREADESVLIGPPPARDSYLDQAAILAAAERTGADCIHPGYGFLSENADFANACERAGLTFVGPPTGAIDLMGSKRRAKIAMQAAGVPVVPGFEDDHPDDATLIAAAADIGFPIMVKASAGGGGRGMRLVQEASELADNLQRARSEARSAFGDDELILEKAVLEPRHIEIQVFADSHGNAVYLGERDCSIQRRHQKVVEEAPSPFMTPELRQAMGEAAVRAALACNYRGAGTVEFLVDQDRQFYFLEMNTRLQVEHPVTELITGQDLVAWQLLVAEGRPLPLQQSDIMLHGHAIEVRLYAEDPARDFMPQTGTLACFRPALNNGIRVDAGVTTGDVVSPWYDPMLAKVIAWGDTRDDARRRLIRSLEDSVIAGVTTNQAFLSRVIAHPQFGAGRATTAFLEREFAEDPTLRPAIARTDDLALAAILFCLSGAGQAGWSNNPATAIPLRLSVDDTDYTLQVRQAGQQWSVTCAGDTRSLTVFDNQPDRVGIIDRGVRHYCQYHLRHNHLYLLPPGRSVSVTDVTHQPPQISAGKGSGRLQATMDGAVIAVTVAGGDTVRQGETLVVLEAMKMEHPIKADRDGQVQTVHVSEGHQVRRHQLLIELTGEPDDH